jgi:hypothetical protein
MWTDAQIELAAVAAAEKANGGKFVDPLFYKPEHQRFWRNVVRTALEATDAPPATKQSEPPNVSKKEIEEFSDHCVYIRSVYVFATRLLRDCDEQERKSMEAIAPSIFADLAQLLTEYLIIAACRITDPAVDGRNNENLTIELFVNDFSSDPETYKQLDELHQRMKKLRKKILPARHKLAAHADRDAIREGKPLGAASWQEWNDFWSALADFVRILNQKKIGKPFEINASGVRGDAEMLLKALKQSQYFETLVDSDDPTIRDACIELALPSG